MQNSEVLEELRLIKKTMRGVMNGMTSSSMRNKGLTYKVNFGVELPRLQEMSSEFSHTYELSSLLWKEDIRECRLLAGMLMPVEQFDAELADVWVDQMRFTEEAECTVMYLFSRAPWASTKVFEWIASERPMAQLCGYLLLARLFMNGNRLQERDEHEYLDQTQAALHNASSNAVRTAALKCLYKYMDLGEKETQSGDRILDRI